MDFAPSRRFWLCLLLLIVAYTLPWIVNPGASLTLGAFDLAEWSSLHPAVRSGAMPLLTPFLLRFPLACIGLAAAFTPSDRRWLSIGAALILALALLPPVEFFTQYRDDPNYRQQFALAVLASGGALFTLYPRFRNRWISLFWMVIGTLSGGAGLLQALSLMRELGMPDQAGIGPFLLLLIVFIQMVLYRQESNRAISKNTALPIS